MLELILSLLWLVVKISLVLVAIYVSIIVGLHLRAVSRLNFYERQGAVHYPGNKRFFFGNTVDLIEYGKIREGPETVCGP